MRIYLPATTTLLHELLERGSIGPAPLTAFAVTPGLREWYVDEDAEELEYAATVEAADVADAGVTVRDDLDRGVVEVAEAVPLTSVASIHVDDAEAEATVADAAEAVIAADLGDPGSQDKVDDAEGYELSWYATQEIAAYLALL
jgi:hypothetical protein